MAITLTDSAVERVKTMIAKRGKGIGLHLSTKVSGCTGFAYVVDYADEVGEHDVVYDYQDIKLVVPQKSLAQLDGMTLDYAKSGLLNEGFEFINPNVKDTCGCGESFSV